jgi:choline-sulfatase
MISYVDERIGELLATLAATGLDRDTVVVLTSDHGDFLGERGLWYKMSFLEPSVRVPLIVHAPGHFEPRRVATPVSLLDLFPTVLDLTLGAGWSPAAPLDGKSLLPLLAGTGVKKTVVGEYLAEGAVAPCVMLRRGAEKYIHSPADPDLLYDLAADPDELTNLAARPEHAERLAGFRAEVERRWDLKALHAAVLASQRRRLLVAPALATGRRRSWDHQPDFDAADQYVRTHMPLEEIERRARLPLADGGPEDG